MAGTADLVREFEELGARLAQAKAMIARRFIGQPQVVDLALVALLCGGHGLLVGVPGLGKTSSTRRSRRRSSSMTWSTSPASKAFSPTRSSTAVACT